MDSKPKFKGIAPYIEVFDMPQSLKLVRFAFVDVDFRNRAEPAEILRVLKNLQSTEL